MNRTPETKKFIHQLIQTQANERTRHWLGQQEEKLRQPHASRAFHLAFGTATRFATHQPVALSEAQQQEAQRLRKGFQPTGWPMSQWVRTYLLLLNDEVSDRNNLLSRLLETADVDEQVAIYSALPLLSHPDALVPLATNGLRTNITLVFDAIVRRNPFPADHLSEAAWNQMVLKAVFMARPLYLIYGADARANPDLARMLVDFAHERWAANRTVTPELWRFVAPYADESHRADLERLITSEDSLESAAGRLASRQSKSPELHALVPDDTSDLPSWQQIGEDYVKQSERRIK